MLQDFGDGETNELAVVLENTDTGQHTIEVRDIQTGGGLNEEMSTQAVRHGNGAIAYWTLLVLALALLRIVSRDASLNRRLE